MSSTQVEKILSSETPALKVKIPINCKEELNTLRSFLKQLKIIRKLVDVLCLYFTSFIYFEIAEIIGESLHAKAACEKKAAAKK